MALQEPSPNRKSSQYNTYLKYSGLAFQLLAAIGVLGWLGYLLDKRLNLIPLFTLLFGFLAFGGMMYQIYRSINK
jgi:F0F1-type ATP synthase assembly protein I